MFKFLLLFSLMFFLVIFLLGGFTFMKLFGRVRDLNRQFGGADTRRRQSRPGTNGSNGAGVYDPRNHADRNKKIIPKDEGEYVDYENVK